MLALFESRYALKGRYNIGNVGKTASMSMLALVYLDSQRASILIEAVLPTLPMLYLPFNAYLDSKRASILIEADMPTLPMLYLPFNVYLDSQRASILIEADMPTLPMLVPSLHCIS